MCLPEFSIAKCAGAVVHRSAKACATTAFALLVHSVVALSAVATADLDAPKRGDIMVDRMAEELQHGSLAGVLVDATTGETIPGAVIRIRELERNRVTALDGSFRFDNLPPRTYTLVSQHLGFAPGEMRVRVDQDDTVNVRFEIFPSVLEHPGVIVTGTGRERHAEDTYRPSAVVTGTELQRQLQSSVAATIAHVPGISVQYNGPAATQPVIRGMGGDRVLMLEDGQRTGDLATTGADHATAVEPVTAERIEVVRGPAGLLYGSNALGGVINVIRGDIPRSRPAGTSGTVTLTGESVSTGGGGGAAVTHPFGNLVVRGELSGRIAGDVRTPRGMLPSSDMETFNGSLGLSWITPWGFAGVSGRQYAGSYGVPGEFQGELIPGAHPGGVEIEFVRRLARLRAAHVQGIGMFNSFEVDANLSHYVHDEIEGRGVDAPIYGARFDQVVGNANFIARHEHDIWDILNEGALGLYFYARDLIAVGAFTGSRSASEWSVAGYIYEEIGFDPFSVEVGARYDYTEMTPVDRRPIRTEEGDVPVGPRQFGAFSASVSGLFNFRPGWSAGVSLARAFRNPSVEELYSDGPHLADFSYDIGNPGLDPEYGYGVDLFVRATGQRFNLDVSAFLNRVVNYIYYHPTGQIDQRFFRFPVFLAQGDNASFVGAEGRLKWEFSPRLVIDGTLSYVRATRLDVGDPLPAIPPLNGRIEIRYERRDLFATAGVRGAASQNRVPNAIAAPLQDAPLQLERPTDGYGLVDLGVGYRWIGTQMLHTISLQARNVLDVEWRDHLSRIKDVVPQPGRNIQISYRVNF